MKTRKWLGVGGVMAVVLCLGVSPALSLPVQQFFGEDEVGGNRNAPRPNSEAARTAFLANLSGVATEDFEGFANLAVPSTLTFGSDTASFSALSTLSVRNLPSGNTVGRFPTSGTKYVEVAGVSGNFMDVVFSTPQAAFGFFGTDIGDFLGQLTIAFDHVDGTTTVLDIPHGLPAPDGAVLYFGAIATSADKTFTKITFGNTGSSADFFGFDDLTIGRLDQVIIDPDPNGAIPEPVTATLGLLSFGALLLATSRRRVV